jgi:ubiquitin C-terminal hydrolase
MEQQSVDNEDINMEEAEGAGAEPEENFEYKLVGVVLHMGTADAGHYLSYININRNTQEDKPEWVRTD